MKNAFAVATVASCVAAICHAATPAAPLPESLLACAKIQDSAERVKCYDAQVESLRSQTPATTSPAASVPPLPGSPVSAAASQPAAVAPVPAPSPRQSVSASGTGTAQSTAAMPPAAVSSVPAVPHRAQTAEGGAGAVGNAPAESSDSQFGRELLPPSERPKLSAKETELLSQITGLQLVRPNIRSISLANGQVWLQEEVQDTAVFLRVGDSAHIDKGPLGAYRLWTASVGEKNWVRVRRVR